METQMEANSRTVAQTSAEATALKARIVNMKVDEVLFDGQASVIIGGDWRERPYIVATARRQALQEAGVVTVRVRNTGWKRVAGAEILTLGDDAGCRMKRIAKRAAVVVSAAEDGALTPEERNRRNMQQAIFGTVAFVLGAKQQKKVLEKAGTQAGPLAIGDTLKLFGGSSEK